MSTKGIRISDLKENKCISLSELLDNIPNADQFNWVLLWFDVIPKKKEGRKLVEIQKKIQESNKGLSFTFSALTELSKKIFQEIEVLIIGCKNKENIHQYKDDQEMYETCDLVIEMIDGGFWEVFSKNINWIDWLAKKYKKVEYLSSNFQQKIPRE